LSKQDHKELDLILKGCRKLQPEWQRALYDLLFDSILMTVSQFRISKPEAEDLIQESFIRIFNSLDTYDYTKSNIKTWASVIARRLAINYSMSFYKKNLSYSLDDLESHRIIEHSPSIDLDIERVDKALSQIPDKYRLVFELCVFQGLRHQAVADELQIAESTSRVYLSRAIELIRKDFKSVAS